MFASCTAKKGELVHSSLRAESPRMPPRNSFTRYGGPIQNFLPYILCYNKH